MKVKVGRKDERMAASARAGPPLPQDAEAFNQASCKVKVSGTAGSRRTGACLRVRVRGARVPAVDGADRYR